MYLCWGQVENEIEQAYTATKDGKTLMLDLMVQTHDYNYSLDQERSVQFS